MILGEQQKIKKANIKRFLKRCFQFSINGYWTRLWNYIASEGTNLLLEKQIYKCSNFLFCPLCELTNKPFVHLSNHHGIAWNSACPNCNSRSRHRGLFFLYKEYLSRTSNKRILHFAPEPVLKFHILKYVEHQYYTTDYNMLNVDFPGEDIQKLSFTDSSFDLIFNNHVLEHVQDDKIALSEIARVLSEKGIAIITIPGDWRRKRTKIFNHLNFNGHYRDYGLDVINLMKCFFSKVEIKYLYIYNGDKHAIKPTEVAFICSK